MYFILIVSILAIGIIIERFIFLFFKYNINANAFMAQIQKLVMANSIDKAIKLCNAAPSAALAKRHQGRSDPRQQGSGGDPERGRRGHARGHPAHPKAHQRAAGAREHRDACSDCSGTIIGMIGAFNDLAEVPPEQRQQALGKNISLAMNTTAFGLIVAIPSMMAHVFLSGVTKKIIDEIDLYSVKLENLLISRSKPGRPWASIRLTQ